MTVTKSDRDLIIEVQSNFLSIINNMYRENHSFENKDFLGAVKSFACEIFVGTLEDVLKGDQVAYVFLSSGECREKLESIGFEWYKAFEDLAKEVCTFFESLPEDMIQVEEEDAQADLGLEVETKEKWKIVDFPFPDLLPAVQEEPKTTTPAPIQEELAL